MNKLYFVKLNELGISEDKIHECDIEKETEKVIFAKEKGSPLSNENLHWAFNRKTIFLFKRMVYF